MCRMVSGVLSCSGVVVKGESEWKVSPFNWKGGIHGLVHVHESIN